MIILLCRANIVITLIICISLVIWSFYKLTSLAVGIKRIWNYEIRFKFHEALAMVLAILLICFDGVDKDWQMALSVFHHPQTQIHSLVWPSDIKDIYCVQHWPQLNTNHKKNTGLSRDSILPNLTGKKSAKSDSPF